MDRFLNTSFLYFKNIVNHKNMIFFIGAFVFFAVFLIPNEKSNYVTFYVGRFSGIANNMWVSNLSAIFSNILLSFFGFFLFEGIAKKEYENNRLVRASKSSNFFILLHRWFAYVLTLLFFSIIITLTILIINYKKFNIFSFLYPFLYFSIPFIFLMSSIILIIDSLIKKKLIKILLFIGIFIFLLAPTPISKYIDIFGLYEFIRYIEKDIEGSNFAIGYIRKTSKISLISIKQYYINSNLLIRLFFIPTSILFIYIFSFVFDRYKKNERRKNINKFIYIEDIYKYTSSIKLETINIKVNLFNLFNAFFLLFRKSFSRLEIIIITTLWLVSFFLNENLIRNITIPLIFLISFTLFDKYLNIRENKMLDFIHKGSVFSEIKIVIVYVFILYLYYILCLLPLLYFNVNTGNIFVKVFIFSVFISISSYINLNKLIEIIYILIFICYLCGYPIINVF